MERALQKTRHLDDISQFIHYANKDKQAEFETKLLAGADPLSLLKNTV